MQIKRPPRIGTEARRWVHRIGSSSSASAQWHFLKTNRAHTSIHLDTCSSKSNPARRTSKVCVKSPTSADVGACVVLFSASTGCTVYTWRKFSPANGGDVDEWWTYQNFTFKAFISTWSFPILQVFLVCQQFLYIEHFSFLCVYVTLHKRAILHFVFYRLLKLLPFVHVPRQFSILFHY